MNIKTMLHPYHHPAYADYETWKTARLSAPNCIEPVILKSPEHLADPEKRQILEQIRHHNMALFHVESPEKFHLKSLCLLGKQLGLRQLDNNLYADKNAVSELRVIDKGRRGEYIPYTNQSLGWHTDGYYNTLDRSIYAFMLYCQQPAHHGGENQLLNPELAYIYLHEKDYRYCEALAAPDVFTIPATYEEGRLVRPKQQNPVFSIHPGDGSLDMRYTQRKIHIEWKNNALTRDALYLLRDFLNSDTVSIFNIRLSRGEGLICNNVLHNRSAFNDSADSPRVMYRARYHDRISF